MSVRDAQSKNSSEAQPSGKIVEFWVDCPVCNEESGEVEYFPTEGVMRWSCPNGHKNYLEDVWVPL